MIVKKRDLIFVVIGLIIGIAIFLLFFNNSNSVVIQKDTVKNDSPKDKKILYWKAPMNPNEIYDKPGKSNMGMYLVPVYEDELGSEGIVKIDGQIQQNMNIKTEVVKKGELSSSIVTNGILQTDERKEFIINTKVGGWVENLYVNYTGQEVKKGQKLIDIYSPNLVAAQQEFLTAISYSENVKNNPNKNISSTGNDLIENSIRKLELLDITKEQIEKLKVTKQIQKYITLYAPFNGTVISKEVIEGQKINPGSTLLKIADLKNLWLIADVYEYELSKVKIGADTEIKFNFLPGKIFNRKITFIYPTLNPKTRTAKIRIDIPNYKNELKPSMFATIVIKGQDIGTYPLAPEQAIIRSGQKNVIVLALGEGKFKPVEVKLGSYSNGYYQVLSGIDEGANIVTSSQFLIDSESNLKAALNQYKQTKDNNNNPEIDEKDTTKTESELIRKGIIDVEAIDKNKDGKLFQDVMDWNVLSDRPGICPLCGMTLKEFTINEIKDNLTKNGYKFK
ncbi:MAG: efflux RND transporter periplasmic adaptor subunit [Ignavibacteriales bacterium CG12_big_fil_rev_8_21_14_0_65_30_8]|nr:MAG: efflux RND transporter periplasmic adaptor subunit [Ignavibacteriales bacterium CG12_big_fil_rev_8_21_14_0_65_30_8]